MLICAIQIILALVVLGVAVVAAYICLQGDAPIIPVFQSNARWK